MYNPNQSASSRRAGEEFLRRMNYSGSQGCNRNAVSREVNVPVFNQGGTSGCCENHESHGCTQSYNSYMPALAMVYSPIQEWACLMETPEKALSTGTLFQELNKPFYGSGARRSNRC